jgi:hypothetical protein
MHDEDIDKETKGHAESSKKDYKGESLRRLRVAIFTLVCSFMLETIVTLSKYTKRHMFQKQDLHFDGATPLS